jgi:hypothetical protein
LKTKKGGLEMWRIGSKTPKVLSIFKKSLKVLSNFKIEVEGRTKDSFENKNQPTLVHTFVERLVSIVTSISSWSLYVHNGKTMNNLLKEHNIYIKFIPKIILTLGLTLVLVVFIHSSFWTSHKIHKIKDRSSKLGINSQKWSS